MKIGIDIDGVLTDEQRYVLDMEVHILQKEIFYIKFMMIFTIVKKFLKY